MTFDPVSMAIAGAGALFGKGGSTQVNPYPVYQSRGLGKIDAALADRLLAPQAGAEALNTAEKNVRRLLGEVESPRYGGMLAERIRSAMASRGLGESPLGAVIESSMFLPTYVNTRLSLANQLAGIGQAQAGLESNRLYQMLNYLNQGIGATGSQANSDLLAAQQSWGRTKDVGSALGDILSELIIRNRLSG